MITAAFNLEASSRLLTYSKDDNWVFEEITTIQSQDQRIDFSALVDIRQSREIHGQYIDVWMIHICDQGKEDPKTPGLRKEQSIKNLQLCQIPLFDNKDRADRVFSSTLTFVQDPRPCKQLIKCNFADVPIDGPGTYAVALSIFDGEEKKRTFLDCSYIEIT